MSSTMMPYATETVLASNASTEWIHAWRALRDEGYETVMLDGFQHSVEALLLNTSTGTLQRLRWTPGGEETSAEIPSQSGIAETADTEQMLSDEYPWLHWNIPTRKPIRGKGLFVYPLGPVRADVAEALLYRLIVMGDEIVALDLKPHFKRRHIRTLVQDRSIAEAMPVIERFTTTSTVAHTLAMTLAVEDAWGIDTNAEIATTRMLMAELERCSSHFGDLAALAVSTGLPVPQMEYLHLKESLLRINSSLFGHRYLRGSIRPGGLDTSHWPSDIDPVRAAEQVRSLLDAHRHIEQDLQHTPSFLDRLSGVGVVPSALIQTVRPVGPVGRAAGRNVDVRRDLPYLRYSAQPFEIPTDSRADCVSRLVVRVQELHQSINMVRRILQTWDPQPLWQHHPVSPLTAPSAKEEGLGIVEAPRGLLSYRIILDNKTGRIRHLGVATPSQRNWTIVPHTMANGNILQDFPIIDASFSLSVAGWDG